MRIVALLIAAILMLAGCWQSETRAQTHQIERRTGIESGQPTDLTITTQATEETRANAGLDPAAVAAIARQAATAAVEGAKSAIPGLSAITAAFKDQAEVMVPKDDGVTPLGAAGGITGIMALIIAALKAREAMAYKKDADEGWNLAHANALKVPPP